MARPRADTSGLAREAHSVSVKVLRLSRPSLAQQYPLPRHNTAQIPHVVSLAYPSSSSDQQFALSPNLALPPAFGSAYVGETFSCSLCANNELTPVSTKSVSGVKIVAEMQTPTQTIPLQLYSWSGSEGSAKFQPGDSIQSIVHFDLKEEGNHVLAVNVTYSETSKSDGDTVATSGKARSFRKLYQFLAQPCLNVRTKATELKSNEVVDKSLGPYGKRDLLVYCLEAQLENVSESRLVLEQTLLHAVPPFKSTPLNKDEDEHSSNDANVLNPHDVLQFAFLVEQENGVTAGLDDLKLNLKRDGRTVLGHIAIQWRSSMGEKGSLSTGNLLTRRGQ